MAQTLMFEDGNNAGELGKETSHTETTNSTPPFTRAVRDVLSLCKLRRIVVAFLLALFPFPVEREFHLDLEIFLTARNRNCRKKIHPCESRCLLLKFSREIAQVVFTGECIFPEGTKLELVNAVRGHHVRQGPLASAQVEIFLLNGEENWTIEELNSHIMMQKRGGKSGSGKNPYLRLEGGVVCVDEIKFKHRQKHMKKLEMVRLGARVVDQSHRVIVKEAVTGPVTIKDKRLKPKKRYPPSPTDDVWRLEQIYRNGAFHNRLTENGIKTVEDFLIELYSNPRRLRCILGKSMSDDYWKKATTHAKTCNIDGRTYLYYHMETEKKFAVAFNVAGQRTAESSQWVVSAECSTSYAIVDQQAEPDGMSLDIPAPGHTTTPNQITSVNLGDYWEKIMQLLNSDELQFEDFPYREPGQANYSAAETSSTQFYGLQHDESMDLSQNQFTDLMISEDVHTVIHEDGTNANQWLEMNDISMVPVASMCKGKSKKSWAKISSILRWFLLKRFVKHTKVQPTKKRKLSR